MINMLKTIKCKAWIHGKYGKLWIILLNFLIKSLSPYGVQCLYKKKYIFIYEPIENIKKLLKIRL